MHRERDNQRSKVYAWEESTFNPASMMELSEIRKLVTRVAHDYGMSFRKVRVGDGRGRRRACYDPNTRQIKLPRWSRKRWIVCHELAHWIEVVQHPDRCAWHGRQFVGLYMELLRRYDGRDLRSMMDSARAARIDFSSNAVSTARWLKKNGLKQLT